MLGMCVHARARVCVYTRVCVHARAGERGGGVCTNPWRTVPGRTVVLLELLQGWSRDARRSRVHVCNCTRIPTSIPPRPDGAVLHCAVLCRAVLQTPHAPRPPSLPSLPPPPPSRQTPPRSKLMSQPPHDLQLGDAAFFHYTWGSLYNENVRVQRTRSPPAMHACMHCRVVACVHAQRV